MESFTYQVKEQCSCGASLYPGPADVVRPYPWGDVFFRRCTSCRSYVQSPQIAQSTLARWYDSEHYQGGSHSPGVGYHNYLADEQNRLDEARQRYLADLAPLLPVRASVFEIGCATGSLLRVIREAGHTVSGADISERFVQVARAEHRLDVFLGDFLTMPAQPASLDAVIMLGTISNLDRPESHLRKAHDMLRPKGLLFANLPVVDSIVAQLYGKRYWMFTPSVSNFMTREGARRLFDRSGYRVMRMATDRQKPSIGKLLNHAGASALQRWLDRASLGNAHFPIAVPIPGIVAVWARRD